MVGNTNETQVPKSKSTSRFGNKPTSTVTRAMIEANIQMIDDLNSQDTFAFKTDNIVPDINYEGKSPKGNVPSPTSSYIYSSVLEDTNTLKRMSGDCFNDTPQNKDDPMLPTEVNHTKESAQMSSLESEIVPPDITDITNQVSSQTVPLQEVNQNSTKYFAANINIVDGLRNVILVVDQIKVEKEIDNHSTSNTRTEEYSDDITNEVVPPMITASRLDDSTLISIQDPYSEPINYSLKNNHSDDETQNRTDSVTLQQYKHLYSTEIQPTKMNDGSCSVVDRRLKEPYPESNKTNEKTFSITPDQELERSLHKKMEKPTSVQMPNWPNLRKIVNEQQILMKEDGVHNDSQRNIDYSVSNAFPFMPYHQQTLALDVNTNENIGQSK